MHWNYRVLRHAAGWIAIHEVYYDDAGRPRSCTVEPVNLSGDSVDELQSSLKLIERAFQDPVLDYEGFETKSDPKP